MPIYADAAPVAFRDEQSLEVRQTVWGDWRTPYMTSGCGPSVGRAESSQLLAYFGVFLPLAGSWMVSSWSVQL